MESATATLNNGPGTHTPPLSRVEGGVHQRAGLVVVGDAQGMADLVVQHRVEVDQT